MNETRRDEMVMGQGIRSYRPSVSNGIIRTNVPAALERPGTRPLHTGGAMMKSILSGIYEIRNTQNNHRYIGSSADIETRWRGHKKALEQNKHHSPYLQRAWLIYGADCFVFSVLEYCEGSKLFKREQFYFDSLQPEYNVAKVAGSPLGVRHSKEFKKKVSEVTSGEKNGMFGKSHSPESIEKMRKNRSGIARTLDAILRSKNTWFERYQDKHRKLGAKHKNRVSKYFGVGFYLSDGRYPGWQVKLTVNKKQIYLGQYKDEITAAKVYDDYVIKNNLQRPLNFGRDEDQ